MTTEYRIVDNDDDRWPGQTLIETLVDGEVVARSWAPSKIDPAIRLNPDMPSATDDRTDTDTTDIAYRVPSEAEAKSLGLPADQHQVLATYAAVVDAVSVKDAAKAAGVTEQTLIDEAKGWAAAATFGLS